MDESRKAFEKWYRLNWGHTEDCPDDMFEVSGRYGYYKRLGVRMAHDAWKSSRETIHVNLTPEINPLMFNESVIFGYQKARGEDIEAIRAAGIKVKE